MGGVAPQPHHHRHQRVPRLVGALRRLPPSPVVAPGADRSAGCAGRLRLKPRAALAVLTGITLAWVRMSHTWDLPVLVALTVAAVLLGAARQAGDSRRAWLRAGGHVLVIGIVTTAVSWPYVRASEVFDRGFTSSVARTPLGAFLLQYGIPLAVAALFVLRRVLLARRSGRLPELLRSPAGLAGVVAMAVGVVAIAAGRRGPVFALALVVAVATLVSAGVDLRRGRLGRGLAAAFVAAGIALAAFPDLWVVINDIGRQNTVFKFGYTAWVLIALGAAAMAAELLLPGPACWGGTHPVVVHRGGSGRGARVVVLARRSAVTGRCPLLAARPHPRRPGMAASGAGAGDGQRGAVDRRDRGRTTRRMAARTRTQR
ncbi:MAG: DUF2298 domain-containing protein [Microthrixaceae bacterium]|nr:DUF2298 domain-containing protein [Microthrixaceae bacterium]